MAKPQILLIEDSGTTQETLKKAFSELGCEVVDATSSEEALVYLKSGRTPDVIILDFKLPGMNGPQFYQEIVFSPKWQDIKVIPFTSLVTKKERDLEMLGQWQAGTQVMEKVMAKETLPIVSKGEQGEDVLKVPPELVISVGKVLHRKRVLPTIFRQMMSLLIESPGE